LPSIAVISQAKEGKFLFILMFGVIFVETVVERTPVCVEIMVSGNSVIPDIWGHLAFLLFLFFHFFSQFINKIADDFEFAVEAGIINIAQVKDNRSSLIYYQMLE
jgi:hypothetical protein